MTHNWVCTRKGYVLKGTGYVVASAFDWEAGTSSTQWSVHNNGELLGLFDSREDAMVVAETTYELEASRDVA